MRNSVKSYTYKKKSFIIVNGKPEQKDNSYIAPAMEKIKSGSRMMWLEQKSIRALIGIRLRQAREAKGISQMDLGFQIGADQQYISKVEQGKVNISVENLYKITYYLDLWINLTPKENKIWRPKRRNAL